MKRLIPAALAVGLLLPLVPAQAALPTTEGAADRASIAWHDCDPSNKLVDFECGTLTVPVDWDDTNNPDVAQISFGIHRATRDRVGALSFNPGGPGGSGMNSAMSVFRRLPREIQERFDFVAWDPRGVGESTPNLSGCTEAPKRDSALFPNTGSVDWLAVAIDDSVRKAPALAACFAANPRVAPYLGTYYVIRDLDALRAELGFDQWNFWGMSYGTRIGYQYARQFPSHIRALILDGSLAPNETMIYRGSQGAYKYAQSAATFGAAMGPEVAMKLRRITHALNHRTVTINGRESSRWSIMDSIYMNIASQTAWNYVVGVINRTYDALFGAQPDAKTRRLPSKPRAVDPVSQRYFLPMVNCADVRDRPTVEEIASVMASAYEVNSVSAATDALGRGRACEGLPLDFAPALPYLTKPLELPVPPVVVQSYGDSRTPWTGGRAMASSIAGASLITYEGTQHVTYMRTVSSCLNNPVTQYLLTAQVPTSRTCPYAKVRS